MKSIQQAILDGHFVLDVEQRDIELILRQAVSQLVTQGVVPVDRRDEVEAALMARERQASTALGHAVAVPHAYLEAIAEPVILFMRLAHPVNLGAPDGVSTRFVFVLLGPPDHAAEHLDSLATIARLMSDNEFRYDAGRAKNQQDLLAAVERFGVRTAPAPPQPAAAVTEGLRFSGTFGGGMTSDVRRRLAHYASDFATDCTPSASARRCFCSLPAWRPR